MAQSPKMNSLSIIDVHNARTGSIKLLERQKDRMTGESGEATSRVF